MAKREPAHRLADEDRPRRSAPVAAVDRRGVALACGAVLFLVCLLAYAGASWAVVLYQLAADGPLLAAWLLSSLGLGAALLRAFRLRGDDNLPGLLTMVTSIALGLGAVSLAVLGLGRAGWLNRATAVALIGVGIVLAVVEAARYRTGRRPGETDAAARAWFNAPAGWAWLWLAVMPLLAMAVVGAVVPPGFLWTPDEPHGYDVVEYHLQVPREWYEAGQIVPLRHNVFSFFPFGVESHYLLAMHLRGGPWNGMYLAQLMHAAHVVLTVLALYGFARRTAPRAAGAVFAGVLAASVPWLTLLAPIAYNEGGLLLYGTLAVGWASGAARPDGGWCARTLALAGAMAGFACGTKLTAVPMVLAAVPAAVAVQALARRPARAVAVVAGATAFVLVGLLVFAPWIARNIAWAGNPVFPEAMPLLGRAHFSEVQVERWQRAHKPPPAQASVPARFKALGREVLFNWQFGYGLLPLAVVATVMSRGRGDSIFLGALLLMLAGFWLALTHLQGRFFVLAVPLAAMLIAGADWGRRPWVGAAAAVVAAGVGVATVHSHFSSRMYGPQGRAGVIGVPGEALEQLHPPELQGLAPDATVTLVGDAKAFWYPRTMRSLRYRTVFDVDTSSATDVVEAWRGRPVPNEWLLIDPGELTRFSQTYFGVPPPPPEVRARQEPYVVASAGVPVAPSPLPPPQPGPAR